MVLFWQIMFVITPVIIGILWANAEYKDIIREKEEDKMKREDVYKLIDGEREYQNKRWNRETTTSEGYHQSPEEWIMYMEDYLAEAKHILSREATQVANPKAMEIVRKVAAMCVAAMEQLDTAPRK